MNNPKDIHCLACYNRAVIHPDCDCVCHGEVKVNLNFESKARDLAESVYEANDRFEKVVEIIEKALRSVHDEALEEAAKIGENWEVADEVSSRIRSLKVSKTS